ncbi:MAG: TIGR00159 family protein [Erysipelotrichia bacterium]|nr:TIGR00159 family protein [Erysipelotrichia bacterium]NCC53935.1 TIGR00159 family protein [Erysipelotrichia bacterium]
MFNSTTWSGLWNLASMMIDIGIVAVVIYYCLKIVKNNSRTIQIFKGILFIIIANGLAQLLNLSTVEWFTNQCLTWGFLAMIIIFQPEIRNLLEKMGKTMVFSRITTLTVNERERLVNELVKTSVQLSKTKTGAIISIEQAQSLSDYIKTGTAMNSVVSSELLCSIFQYGTPLHDGAVIIQGDKIACASAYFPPTTREFPSSYGARHRAAVGISEISDCVTIVVSEETGDISIAREGSLIRMNEKELREYLLMSLCQTNAEVKKEEVESVTDVEKIDEETSLKDLRTKNDENKLKISFMSKNKKHKRYAKKKVNQVEHEEIKTQQKRQAKSAMKEEEHVHDDKIEAQQIVVGQIKTTNKDEEGSDS